MLLYSVPNLWVWYVHEVEPITAPFILPITQIAMTGSVYSVVAVAVERYFNICKPFSRNMVILYFKQLYQSSKVVGCRAVCGMGKVT